MTFHPVFQNAMHLMRDAAPEGKEDVDFESHEIGMRIVDVLEGSAIDLAREDIHVAAFDFAAFLVGLQKGLAPVVLVGSTACTTANAITTAVVVAMSQ